MTRTTLRDGMMLATGIPTSWTNADQIEDTLKALVPEGQYARVETFGQASNIWEIDIYQRGTGEYKVTILVTPTGTQLEERYYPAHGQTFSNGDNAPYECDTQINILGRFPDVETALQSYRKEGTSTTTGREPVEIYI